MSVHDNVRHTGRRTERLARILDAVASRGAVQVAEICAELGVSEATIRRDLAVLDRQGLVQRTHGGAAGRERADEFPVRYRDVHHPAAKRRIAAACAQAVERRTQTVALGGGSTTSEVARMLAGRSELTVVTNALNIATEFIHRPKARVIITGGHLRPESLEMVGPWTERFLESITIGTAIMGVDGISVEGGLTTHDPVEARANHQMIRHAQRVIVVADASKVGIVTTAEMAGIDQVHLVITEKAACDRHVAALQARGIEVWRV